MTDATDPLLRDPLVQYLGILRAQHADYHPLKADEFAALREPYLAVSHGIADLVVAAIDSLGPEEGLEEVVGLLRALVGQVATATAPAAPVGEAVDFVAATMRRLNPPAEARFYVEQAETVDGFEWGVRDRQNPRAFAPFGETEDGAESEALEAADALNASPATLTDWFWDTVEAAS